MGLMDRWQDHFFMKSFKRFGEVERLNDMDEFFDLHLAHLLYAFKIELFGSLASIGLFTVEYIKHKLLSNVNKTKKPVKVNQ